MGFYIQGVRIFSGGGFIFRVGNIPGWEIWEIFKSVKYLKVGNIQKWEAFVVGIYSGVGNNQEWAGVQGVDSRNKRKE